MRNEQRKYELCNSLDSTCPHDCLRGDMHVADLGQLERTTMPNWCENDLKIVGKKEEIQRFLDHVKTDRSRFDFETIIPYPDKFRRQDEAAVDWEKNKGRPPNAIRPKDGFNSGGYEWCINNWGTKWNLFDDRFHEIRFDEMEEWCDGDHSLTLHFDTAWSPPVPVIHEASNLFSELTFELRYFEQGCAFNGIYRVKNKEVELDKTGDYFGNRGG